MDDQRFHESFLIDQPAGKLGDPSISMTLYIYSFSDYFLIFANKPLPWYRRMDPVHYE